MTDASSHIVTISGGALSREAEKLIGAVLASLPIGARLHVRPVQSDDDGASSGAARSFTIEEGPFAGTHVKVRPCAAPSTTECTISIGFDGDGASGGPPVDEVSLDAAKLGPVPADIFRSVSPEQFDKLPRPSVDDIQAALDKGRPRD